MLSQKDKARIEILLRDTFAVDTKAGYKLRYHITRALVCPEYAKKIDFIPCSILIRAFTWNSSSEGHRYWSDICYLQEMHDCSPDYLTKYEEEQVCQMLKRG